MGEAEVEEEIIEGGIGIEEEMIPEMIEIGEIEIEMEGSMMTEIGEIEIEREVREEMTEIPAITGMIEETIGTIIVETENIATEMTTKEIDIRMTEGETEEMTEEVKVTEIGIMTTEREEMIGVIEGKEGMMIGIGIIKGKEMRKGEMEAEEREVAGAGEVGPDL